MMTDLVDGQSMISYGRDCALIGHLFEGPVQSGSEVKVCELDAARL